MTDAVPETTLADADVIAIFRSRDWARIQVAKIAAEGLHPFHAPCALIGECLSAMLGADIERARSMTNHFLGGLIEAAKAELARQPAAPSAAQPIEETPHEDTDTNVLRLRPERLN